MRPKPPRVSPETAAVILVADRLIDLPVHQIGWIDNWDREKRSPELARLREAVLALRAKREAENA
jgi:hypothetical protein